MKKLAPSILILLLLTACGRKWEQLWGQDTKPEKEYIGLLPQTLNIAVISDCFFYLDTNITRARYVAVKACDEDNVCVPIPQAQDIPVEKWPIYLVDRGTDTYNVPGLLTFLNIKTGLPGSEYVRVEYVR